PCAAGGGRSRSASVCGRRTSGRSRISRSGAIFRPRRTTAGIICTRPPTSSSASAASRTRRARGARSPPRRSPADQPSMTPADVAVLVCPRCRSGLEFHGTTRDEQIVAGILRCLACGRAWPVRDGLPHLVEDDDVAGLDRVMRLVYDVIAPLHDTLTSVVVPVMQFGSEAATRD